MIGMVIRLGVASLLVGLATQATLDAQTPPSVAPKAAKKAPSRFRVNDQARMQALVREGEKLLKSGATTPYAKLQEGLQRTGCTVALAKPSTKDLSGPELFKRSRQSVVVISSLYYCTRCTKLHATTAGGVVVGTSGEVLTNEHVIRGRTDRKNETIVAMTADGTVIPVREVLASSKKDDVAVIRLDMSNVKSLPPLPLGTNPPPGSEIRVMSHPNKHFYHLSSGIISRYFSENGPGGETEVMSITADYGRGSSGCPVLDRKGNIVGLVSRTSSLYYRQTKEKQENLQMVFKLCVAASSIRTLTEKSEPSVVTALPAIKLKGLPKTRGSVEEPLFLNSNDDLDKLIQDKKLSQTYSKHVDWEKQVVLVFRWSGSGQDQLEIRTKGEEPVTVQFVYRRGRTRDLRPHLKLFVVERGVQWIVESGPVARPKTPKPVGAATEASAFKAVEKVLQVRRRGTLVFARPTTAGVDQLETFLKTYPKSSHREEALYLRGLSLWTLKRYDHAAAAYLSLIHI